MADDREFVLAGPGSAEGAASNLSVGALSAMATSPVGLSVLAVSLVAAVRLAQWRVRVGGHASGVSSMSHSSVPLARSTEDATSVESTASTSTSQQLSNEKKKRSKERRKRGKDIAKEVLAKNGRGRAVGLGQKQLERTANQHSYASSSSVGSPRTPNVDGGHHAYADSAGTFSVTSGLGDDASSVGEELGDPFDEEPPTQPSGYGHVNDNDIAAADNDDNTTTPIASRLRSSGNSASPTTPSANESLLLPSLPLRPSSATIRALSALVDVQPSLHPIHTPLPNVIPDHSVSSVSSSTDASSSTSSSSQSQLSPETPPANLWIDGGAENIEIKPHATAHGSSGKHRHHRHRNSSATTTTSVSASDIQLQAIVGVPASVSAPNPESMTLSPRGGLSVSAWDDSLDWETTVPHTQPLPAKQMHAMQLPPSWSTPGATSSVQRPDERGRRSSGPNAHFPSSESSAASTSYSSGPSPPLEEEEHGELQEEPATLDILFPSLNDPPPHSYGEDGYDVGIVYSSTSSSSIASLGQHPSRALVESDDPHALRTALDAAMAREDQWRMECTRLAGEYERVRWAWTEEAGKWNRKESEMQNQLQHLMSAFGPSNTNPQQRQQQGLGSGHPGRNKNRQNSRQSSHSHHQQPGNFNAPLNVNMQLAMGLGMNPAALMNGMMPVPIMGLGMPPTMHGAQSPTSSSLYNAGGSGSSRQGSAPSSRPGTGSYSRNGGHRGSSRSRSRAPSPFVNTNVNGNNGSAPSPKRASGGPTLAAMNVNGQGAGGPSTPPPLRGSSRSASSNGSGFRYPGAFTSVEGASGPGSTSGSTSGAGSFPGTPAAEPFAGLEDLSSSSVLEVADENEEREGRDGSEDDDERRIPDHLASAILKNPPPPTSSSSRSSSRASNPQAQCHTLASLQVLPSPLPPFTRSYSSSSSSGIASLIMAHSVTATEANKARDIPVVMEDEASFDTPDDQIAGSGSDETTTPVQTA